MAWLRPTGRRGLARAWQSGRLAAEARQGPGHLAVWPPRPGKGLEEGQLPGEDLAPPGRPGA
eukprot:15814618-Heterocapsa_arctica.AAC.1